ncbi:MAG: dihydroorotase [Ruminococcaceae bacterium]|nr:dihydroorotase [Oscillospiraceae bacterium]
MSILIKGGRVVDPVNGFDGVADVLIEKGIVSAIGENLTVGEDTEIINVENHIVVPGLVDMHCHLREPGFEYKEDIASGTKSALGGGFTSVACMPNTKPAIDTAETVKFILDKAEAAGMANVFPIGAISKGLGGADATDIEALKEAGVVAVSDDGRPVENSAMMLDAMRKAYQLGVAVISHCEDISLGKGDMNEGALAESLGYEGISPTSEEVMVARDAILSEQYKLPVHIAHVSTRRSVDIIRRAKEKGAPITCETCPHYFSLTEDAVKVSGANAKMNPPLRNNDDVSAIIEGLADGTVDVIATDHAPHSAEEKGGEFSKAPNGIVGFETAFALGYTYLVEKGHLTLSELVEKMSVNPSKILGIQRGSIGVGDVADIAIFDVSKSYKVVAADMLSKSKNTPYDGFELTGRLLYSIVGGRVALRGGEALWKAYFN